MVVIEKDAVITLRGSELASSCDYVQGAVYRPPVGSPLHGRLLVAVNATMGRCRAGDYAVAKTAAAIREPIAIRAIRCDEAGGAIGFVEVSRLKLIWRC